jgi:histidine phosphotransferase ChpT
MSETGLSDLELSTLLATRLCHDLAGPVGAISAGAELLTDEPDPAFLAEAAHLLRHSAEAAAARLKFLRAAFGVSGTLGGIGTARSLAAAYVDAVAGDRLTLSWAEDAPALAEIPDAVQLLLNLVLVAIEAAHGAGALSVVVDQTTDHVLLDVAIQGRHARLPDTAPGLLAGRGDEVTPRTVPFYWVHRLASAVGGLTIEDGAAEGRLGLRARHPLRTV